MLINSWKTGHKLACDDATDSTAATFFKYFVENIYLNERTVTRRFFRHGKCTILPQMVHFVVFLSLLIGCLSGN